LAIYLAYSICPEALASGCKLGKKILLRNNNEIPCLKLMLPENLIHQNHNDLKSTISHKGRELNNQYSAFVDVSGRSNSSTYLSISARLAVTPEVGDPLKAIRVSTIAPVEEKVLMLPG